MASSVIMKNFKKELFQGNFDLENGNIWVALLSGSSPVATSTFEDMVFFSAAQVYEASGFNSVYTSGGQKLATSAITLNGSVAQWDAGDVTWANSTITSDGCVIFLSATDVNDSKLICFISFNGDKSSSLGDFTIQWNSLGILNLTS